MTAGQRQARRNQIFFYVLIVVVLVSLILSQVK
jgi:uncharacterized membrane protein YtjA (UPF0391 family)